MKEIDHLMENLKQDDIALHKEGTQKVISELTYTIKAVKLHFFK